MRRGFTSDLTIEDSTAPGQPCPSDSPIAEVAEQIASLDLLARAKPPPPRSEGVGMIGTVWTRPRILGAGCNETPVL